MSSHHLMLPEGCTAPGARDSCSGTSTRKRAARAIAATPQRVFIGPEDVPVVADYYCEPHQHRFPLVSPNFADVEGLPPMLIQVGDHEILLSDSERLADECVAAGIEVELQVWPEMWHVFQFLTRKMPESKKAINKMGEYIQSRWA